MQELVHKKLFSFSVSYLQSVTMVAKHSLPKSRVSKRTKSNHICFEITNIISRISVVFINSNSELYTFGIESPANNCLSNPKLKPWLHPCFDLLDPLKKQLQKASIFIFIHFICFRHIKAARSSPTLQTLLDVWHCQ